MFKQDQSNMKFLLVVLGALCFSELGNAEENVGVSASCQDTNLKAAFEAAANLGTSVLTKCYENTPADIADQVSRFNSHVDVLRSSYASWAASNKLLTSVLPLFGMINAAITAFSAVRRIIPFPPDVCMYGEIKTVLDPLWAVRSC